MTGHDLGCHAIVEGQDMPDLISGEEQHGLHRCRVSEEFRVT